MLDLSGSVRSAFFMAVAFGIGSLGSCPGSARAGSLAMLVTESGGTGTVTIVDNGAFDTNPAIGVIDVNSSQLNAMLAKFQFTSLEATSNSPGVTAEASLSQSGDVQLKPGSGTGSIRVDVTDINYRLPSGTLGTLFSSASDTFTNATTGDSQAFRSWFNSSNGPDATQLASPAVTLTSNGSILNSHAEDATPTSFSLTTPYGLTDRMDLSLSGGLPGAPSQVQFTGSTVLIDPASAVPEPASLALMLMALPLAVLGLRWRRGAAGH
jgi:hypothetical protein